MESSKTVQLVGRYWILLLLVALKFVLQYLFVNPVYELHRDEFLHLDQVFHPAAGYISVPPFSSWIATIIYFLGGGLFWIRFFPAFFGVLTIVIVWLTVEELGGRLPAKILAAIFIIFSVLIRLNVLFQPNSFDILAWTIVFYLLIKYFNSKSEQWLWLLSVIVALGIYNKYNILFLLVGLFMGLLLTNQRTIFTKRIIYFAIAFCVLLILPNVIWQIANHFPVIHHMEALKNSQLVNIDRFDFLIEQFKYGLLGILSLAAVWAFIFYKPYQKWRFIGWTFLIVLALYTIARGKNYYAIGLYPVLFAFGSVYLEVIFKKLSVLLISLLVVLQIVVFLLIVRYIMPYQSPAEINVNHKKYEEIGLLHWEDGQNHQLPQDFADMIGWREMAEKAFVAYQLIAEDERANTLIYCDNYGQAGALNYYNRRKMPQAYSFNTDYIYWLPKFKRIQNIVFVGELPSKEVMNLFSDFRLVGVVENEFAREKGTKIFLLLEAKLEMTELFYKLAEERKRKFDIF